MNAENRTEEIIEFFENILNDIGNELKNGIVENGQHVRYRISEQLGKKINFISNFMYKNSVSIASCGGSEPLSNYTTLFQTIQSYCHENFKCDDESKERGLDARIDYVRKTIKNKLVKFFLENIELFEELKRNIENIQ